ncbi:MAG: oxidoreductase [Cyclobacteriaceae bacterium]|nr:oxidoreductase [Cyclobacteriaceae bacterium]
MSTFQVGLVGYGLGGQVFHAPLIQSVQGLTLKTIRATNPRDVQLAGQALPGVRIVDDTAAIIHDPAIDLVVVTAANTFHFPIAKAALLAGKHVVVDKPFTITAAEADELIVLAKHTGRILTVFHNRRLVSDFLTVKKVIESGKLGPIVETEIHYDRFRNFLRTSWKEKDEPGCGILYDLGSHLIDQSLCLYGLPRAITADLRKQRTGSQSVDHFDLRLDYDNHKVLLKSGMLVKIPGPTYMIHGQQGSFVKFGMDVQEAALRAGSLPNATPNWGEEPASQWGQLSVMDGDTEINETIKSEIGDQRRYYANVRDAMLGKATPDVLPEEARNVIRLIEWAEQSHREKRTLELMW